MLPHIFTIPYFNPALKPAHITEFVQKYANYPRTLGVHHQILRRMNGCPRSNSVFTKEDIQILRRELMKFVRIRWLLTAYFFKRRMRSISWEQRNDATLLGTPCEEIPEAQRIYIHIEKDKSVYCFSVNEIQQMIKAAVFAEVDGYEDSQSIRNPQTNEEFTPPQVCHIMQKLRQCASQSITPITLSWLLAGGDKLNLVTLEEYGIHRFGPDVFSLERSRMRYENLSLSGLTFELYKMTRDLKIMCPELQWLISGIIRGFIRADEGEIRSVVMNTLKFLGCHMCKTMDGSYMRRVEMDKRLHSSFTIRSNEWRKQFPMVQNFLETLQIRNRRFRLNDIESGWHTTGLFEKKPSIIQSHVEKMVADLLKNPFEREEPTQEERDAEAERLSEFWRTLPPVQVPEGWEEGLERNVPLVEAIAEFVSVAPRFDDEQEEASDASENEHA